MFWRWFDRPTPQGWQCPSCGRILAPHVGTCDGPHSPRPIIWNDTGTTSSNLISNCNITWTVTNPIDPDDLDIGGVPV